MAEYKLKKQLKKLRDKEFQEDIKKFINSSHEFYSSRVPELKVLANKLHEEHSLKDFYKLFGKFWNSGHAKEVSLGIYTLQLYKDEFTLETWKFIKSKLNDIKSWDKIDAIGSSIVGEILIKYPEIENEILKFSKGKNIWLKRLSIMSLMPLIRTGDFKLAMIIIESHLYDKSEFIHKAIGYVLKEIGDKKPELLKKIIINNPGMPLTTFLSATENIREFRKLRGVKHEAPNNFKKFLFWKNEKILNA